MAITTGAVNVKFSMEIVVNISELHVCDNLLEINAVYHFIRNVGKTEDNLLRSHCCEDQKV